MTRSVKLFAVVLLAVVLGLSSAQNAFAVTELAYDDGTREANNAFGVGGIFAVRFSLPTGWSNAKVLTARYYVSPFLATFQVHIMDNDQVTDLTPPFSVTPSGAGWFDVDLTGKNIIVTRDFYVVALWLTDSQPNFGLDTSTISGRSYSASSLSPPWSLWSSTGNIMFRAIVGPVGVGAPVGGFLEPVNKLSVLTPYLALFGVIGAVAVVVWKKREN